MLRKLFPHFSLKSIILILAGTFTWSLTMVKSGLSYKYGLGFWGPNGHDGVWHIALINSLAKGSLEMPVFAGEVIKNYHIGFDLLVAFLHKVSLIPIHTLYFQIIPPVLAFLTGLLAYHFVHKWTDSEGAAFWSTFFVYFGGNFGWLVTLFRDGSLGGESMFWSQQAASTLINPPFALSLVIILLALTLLHKLMQKYSHLAFFFTILTIGFLTVIKIYAAVLFLFSISVVALIKFLKNRESLLIKVTGASLVFSILLFLPLNANSSGLLLFEPGWFLETMMGYSDRVGWTRFYSAISNYRLGGNWIKGIPAYFVAFLIFWFGNMGTRAIKEFEVYSWFKRRDQIGWIEMFVSTLIIIGGVLPMMFLQTGTPWNTIQFFYYSLFFSGLLAGISLNRLLLEKAKTQLSKILVITVMVVFTLPTTIATLKHYLPSRPPAKLSLWEIEALSFLKDQPDGTVLTQIFDPGAAAEAVNNPPRPLYLYETTAYVSAFSGKPTFLEDEVNLNITGFDWQGRKEKVEEYFNSQIEDQEFLLANDISYVYLVKKGTNSFNATGLEQIFDNSEVTIYKTKTGT